MKYILTCLQDETFAPSHQVVLKQTQAIITPQSIEFCSIELESMIYSYIVTRSYTLLLLLDIYQ